MRKLLVLLFVLSINVLAADDCGVNVYNTATGKLHKRFLIVNLTHPKNKEIVSKKCYTDVEKNEHDANSFDVVAKCDFEDGDKLFSRSLNEYENANEYGRFIATYSYNMFAYEIICTNR